MIAKRILTTEATGGMKMAEDAYSLSNQLIVPKDTVLTTRMIARLKFYSINDIQVYVETGEAKKEEIPIPVIKEQQRNYFDSIRETIAFKQFNKTFLEAVDSIRDSLESVVTKNAPIQEEKMLKEVDQVLEKSRNGLHILDMLHCMRDFDDPSYTHSLNVSLICHIMGDWLNLSKRDTQVLTLCGLFHDIGKLMIPNEIITKPDRLTPTEFAMIKTHPVHGYNILKNEKIDQRIKLAALQHHERCDGSGYPGGSLTNDIAPFSKIVAIADVYDAMTSARVYRPKICPFNVIEIFELEGMRKYDPNYLLPFLERTVDSYIHNNVRLSNEQYGEVVLINKFSLSKPLVKLDNDKGFIDLSKESGIVIDSVI